MVSKFCLFTCVLAVGQIGGRTEWLITPQFNRGQELVYKGSYTEASATPGIHFQRQYQMETRVFVLEKINSGWQVGIVTALKHQRQPTPGVPAKNDPPEVTSVRLEVANLNRQGKLTSPQKISLAPAVIGPPTLETGCFVHFPRIRISKDQVWEVPEPGRPPITWRIVGSEVVSNTKCIKLRGNQQSKEWDQPRADRAAWKRTEYVWVAPLVGTTFKVERTIEGREPGHSTPTQRIQVKYQLDRQWNLPGKLFTARQQEILQARRSNLEANKYLQNHIQYQKQIDVLVRQIELYIKQRPPSPYRLAMSQIKHRIQAVRAGKVFVKPHHTTQKPLIQVVHHGEKAPDFLVTDLITKQSIRLHRLLGRPILIVFYNPKTGNGERALKFARKLHQEYKSKINILGMAVTSDIAYVRKQHKKFKLSFPILDGKGLHRTFGVDATPRFVVLDSNGKMRAGFTGWGFHVPDQIRKKLNQCFPRKPSP